MRVFVTGASGFIGCHVVRQALKAGQEVSILAMPEDPLARLQDFERDIRVVRGNLVDPGTYRMELEKWTPDVCIHLAWYTEPGNYLESQENIVCLDTSLRLIQELIRVGCSRAVMAGTCAEYAASDGILTEDSPAGPATLYGASKLALMYVGARLAAQAGMPFAWGRVFYLYGPYEDPRRLIPSLVRSLAGRNLFQASSGEQARDYLHVEDVARAFLSLAADENDGIYNICSGLPVTMRELMERIGDLLEAKGLIAFGARMKTDWDPPSIYGDNRKMRDLGWTPKIDLESGLRATISYMGK
jgi:nucleoside-diphosphate-sugar epimerase